jgi:8-oxo-dGTP pyrophosphatase MutT (NUDIX family)
MITSRDTGRWVVPKGWTMQGKRPWAAAAIEALEEAGAVGTIARAPCGTYSYDKIMPGGAALPVDVDIYPMIVERLKRNWKERGERRRRWFSPKAAAKRVDEPELAQLLEALGDKPKKVPEIKSLLKRVDI